MATSYISQLATDSVVIESKTVPRTVSGKLAGSYYPGQIVYQSAADTWTATVGTLSTATYAIGVVEFKYRTSSTFGEVDIDNAYTDGTAINVEIIIGPYGPDMTVACLCQNLSVNKFYGNPLQATSGGKLAKGTKKASASVVAIVSEHYPYTAADGVVCVHLVSPGKASQ